MKYSGSITVIDDQGNTVFERELSADELIEHVLLGAKREDTVGRADFVPPVVPVATIKRAYKKRDKGDNESVKKPVASGRKFGEPKPCCGSKSNRCFKTCTTQAKADSPDRPAGGKFSEATFNTIKDLFEAGLTSDAIAGEKGFNLTEVMKIRKAHNYDQYFRS